MTSTAGIERVLGTRIEQAGDDGAARTVLVSDLHIPSDAGPVFAMFGALLDDAASTPGTRLLVLGDLFDVFTGPKQARVGVWRDTAAAIARAVQRGVSVTVLHGNRDFMLDDRFARLAGCRVVPGGLRLRLGERSALLLHGDELCTRDLPYPRAKRLLRNPVTRAVLRHVPLWLALHLADRARLRSARVIASGDQGRFDPTAGAITAAFATGADLLVFGHIHRPARGRFAAAAGAGGEYAILPAFDVAGIHLDWSADRLQYRAIDGSALPDFPPREFC